MSFTWKSQPGKLINAEQINLVRTNVEIVLSNLGSPPYGWNKVPVDPDDLVEFDVLEQLRDAVEYTDTENYCHSHNVTENSPHRTSHFGTYDNNIETGNNATNHGSQHYNNVDTGHQTGNNSTVQSIPHHTGHFTTHYGTYRNNHDATNRNTPHNSSYQGTFNASVK